MPTSDASVISTLICEVMRLRPLRLLDVGPGYGKYGFLAREYLGEGVTIDAVEPWPKALMCEHVYDRVIAGAFPEALPRDDDERAARYDVVLLVDVLEHYEYIDGVHALATALQVAPCVILSTPHRPAVQGSVGGNVFEAHVSQWTLEMLQAVAIADVTLLAPHTEQLLVRLDRRA